MIKMNHIFLKVFVRNALAMETTDNQYLFSISFYSYFGFSQGIKLSYFESFKNLTTGIQSSFYS